MMFISARVAKSIEDNCKRLPTLVETAFETIRKAAEQGMYSTALTSLLLRHLTWL